MIIVKLNDLKIGDEGMIENVCVDENIKTRLLDIGFIRGTLISPILKNKSMTVFKIKGTIIGIRNEEVNNIEVSL